MKKAFIWILDTLQLYGLKITLWIVVTCSFLALATKALIGKPSSAPFDNLLIIAMSAAALAVVIPYLENYVLSKLSEIDIGGVKVIIAKAKEIREEIKFKEISPESMTSADAADRPFPIVKLKGYQLYEYERLSHKIFQTFDEIKDPNDLSAELRDNYRELLKHVGKMAFSVGHYSKYFDIVSRLKLFKDRELNSEELYEVGNAYLWAADEQFDPGEKERYWKESIQFLADSVEKNPFEVKSNFNLGIALLYLGLYDKSIRQMEECINLSRAIIPWAKWNIACGYIRKEKMDEALAMLEEIEEGVWWDGIKDDDWFAKSVTDEFRLSFADLCRRKLSL